MRVFDKITSSKESETYIVNSGTSAIQLIGTGTVVVLVSLNGTDFTQVSCIFVADGSIVETCATAGIYLPVMQGKQYFKLQAVSASNLTVELTWID